MTVGKNRKHMKIASARRDWNAAKNCALEKDKPPIERQPTNLSYSKASTRIQYAKFN
jgi:hypothetical protein